jgi:hypothetical protein
MKYTCLLICFGFALMVNAQDTTKTTTNKKTPVVMTKRVKGVKANPQVIARVPTDETSDAADFIFDDFTVDRYTVMVRNSATKSLAKLNGSAVKIAAEKITGDQIETISLKFSDMEVMETTDYLYRVFGMVPEEVPSDLPASMKVHRTNNLDCYGIAIVSKEIIVMPYNGALIYLRRS